jgi:hypothetical protein
MIAASYIAGIYEEFLARDEIQYLPAIFSFYGLAAAVSLVSFHRYPHLRKAAEQDLAVIVTAEKELGKRWPAARGMRIALEKTIASIPKADTNHFNLHLDIQKVEMESYFSAFGPGLCRARSAVFTERSAADLGLSNASDMSIQPYEYMPSTTEIGNTANPLQNMETTLGWSNLGLDTGLLGFQEDDIGHWLLDNAFTEFPL